MSTTQPYRGFDVLILEPNAAHENDASFRRSIQKFDPGPGRLQIIDRSGVAILDAKNIPFLLNGRGEIAEFNTFLSTRRGKLVPFWNPTWQADLLLASQSTAGASGISIIGTGYTNFQFSSVARRDIVFLFFDRSPMICNRVTSSAVILSDGTETLGLEVPLDRAVSPSECIVSFLPFSRLATDETPDFNWQSAEVVEATLQVTSLPGDTPA